MNMNPFKYKFKPVIFLLGLVIILSFLWYTDHLVGQLRSQLRDFLAFRIKILEQSINENPGGEVSFIFEKIIKTADFPIIYTDPDMNPIYWKNIDVPNISFDSLSRTEKSKLQRLVALLDEKNKPIPIRYQEFVLGYYHYGDSPIILQLQRLPYIEIMIVVLFLLLGYAGFNAIKKSEKRFIWVGMAKETAHQLGTPTSSLMGWLELIENKKEMDKSIIEEMKKDVDRLNKVAERFSKIGSTPRLEELNLETMVHELIEYFSKRLPQRGKKIIFKYDHDGNSTVFGNKELLEWSLENILKNAVDAIEKSKGIISIKSHQNHKWFYIDIEDNGKGIEYKNRKKIFEAGYSTKKRGWGLGLSLVKRIIEDYHKGKIFVLDSKIEEGTVFRIQLPIIKGKP
ncbi:MAG: ATP-binding protein [Calditrichia bacterium]